MRKPRCGNKDINPRNIDENVNKHPAALKPKIGELGYGIAGNQMNN